MAEPPHFPVIVVGGGQAGLSASYLLKERGVPHLVLEKRRVAHSWREERWDTFCLVTPNWQCRLPGHPYTGSDPQGFMLKEEVVAYVESYARRFDLPVMEGVDVLDMAVDLASNRERFTLATSEGRFTAATVIVATGGYHGPRVPAWAQTLPPDVVQLHSSSYKNPGALPRGAVLVVGTGQSGCQIAEDLHLAGRQVHLAVGRAPRCARRYRGKDVVEWLELMGHYDLPVDEHPSGAKIRDRANHYVTGRDGGRDIDLRVFALQGMRLYGPLVSAEGELCRFAPELERNLDSADATYRNINRNIDAYIARTGLTAPEESEYVPPWRPPEEPLSLNLGAANITTVVWCTGFVTDFGWIRASTFDERGKVLHQRGVSAVPGLYFLGLPWLHTWGSGRFSGVARDAEHVVEHALGNGATTRGDVNLRAGTG